MGLAAAVQWLAGRSDVNMRSGGFALDRTAESKKGNVQALQEAAQPDALGLVRVHGHIHAAAVVESQGAVYGRVAAGADGQGF